MMDDRSFQTGNFRQEFSDRSFQTGSFRHELSDRNFQKGTFRQEFSGRSFQTGTSIYSFVIVVPKSTDLVLKIERNYRIEITKTNFGRKSNKTKEK